MLPGRGDADLRRYRLVCRAAGLVTLSRPCRNGGDEQRDHSGIEPIVLGPNRLVRASFQAWCLSTTSRAGASSTLRRPVGLRITAVSRDLRYLYERAGQGDPDDVAAKVRADGGVPDAQVVGDTDAAVKWMRAQTNHNGKAGVFGSCSGGRHAVIYACQRKT